MPPIRAIPGPAPPPGSPRSLEETPTATSQFAPCALGATSRPSLPSPQCATTSWRETGPLGFVRGMRGQRRAADTVEVGVFAPCGQMEIEVSDPSLVGDLVAFLRHADCAAEQVGERTVVATLPRAIGPEAERELSLYLLAWQAMNPNASARIVRHP